ncbi:MAG: hypothetical protein ACNA8L_05480 [Luteolibacter sp.]
MKIPTPSPQALLPWLLGVAVAAGGLLQGLHWRTQAPSTAVEVLENQLRMVTEENQLLRRENEALRSLAQGGGEMPVPQEFIDHIEREFGLEFLSGPVVHRIAREELRDRIAAAMESRFGPSGIYDRQDAYQLIGWLQASDDLLAQLTAVRAVGVRGWFDEVTGEGWVTDRFDLENIPDQGALVRLLARILLHQHFPPPPGYPGDDAARAREALHQGAASGAEGRFLAAQARTIGFLQVEQNLEVEQLMANIAPFIEGITLFPVTAGRGLADTLHVKGNDALHAALRNPPQTTRAIIYPAESADDVHEIELPAFTEEPYLVESAGQLGLRLWLETMGDHGMALDLATAWRGDRYALAPDGEESALVLWDIELATPAETDSLMDVALQHAAATAGIEEIEGINPGPGEIIATADARFLSVHRISPTRIRWINAHERASATPRETD